MKAVLLRSCKNFSLHAGRTGFRVQRQPSAFRNKIEFRDTFVIPIFELYIIATIAKSAVVAYNVARFVWAVPGTGGSVFFPSQRGLDVTPQGQHSCRRQAATRGIEAALV